MTGVLIFLVFVIAMASAVRSTWSPCGVSMLSTVTPLAERSRGNHYTATVGWYVLGAILGGATLGVVMAGTAFLFGALDLGAGASFVILAMGALIATAADAGLGGFHLPGTRRQVNEIWLTRYRSWVYGLGFGWQIGGGVVTYLMTAGVYLLVLAGALTGSPTMALVAGLVFGTIRGLAILTGAGLDSWAKLTSFHRRFEAMRRPVELAMIVVLALVAPTALTALGDPRLVMASIGAAVFLVGIGLRGSPSVVVTPPNRTEIVPAGINRRD